MLRIENGNLGTEIFFGSRTNLKINKDNKPLEDLALSRKGVSS